MYMRSFDVALHEQRGRRGEGERLFDGAVGALDGLPPTENLARLTFPSAPAAPLP
jgi:hypothetical protein